MGWGRCFARHTRIFVAVHTGTVDQFNAIHYFQTACGGGGYHSEVIETAVNWTITGTLQNSQVSFI